MTTVNRLPFVTPIVARGYLLSNAVAPMIVLIDIQTSHQIEGVRAGTPQEHVNKKETAQEAVIRREVKRRRTDHPRNLQMEGRSENQLIP